MARVGDVNMLVFSLCENPILCYNGVMTMNCFDVETSKKVDAVLNDFINLTMIPASEGINLDSYAKVLADLRQAVPYVDYWLQVPETDPRWESDEFQAGLNQYNVGAAWDMALSLGALLRPRTSLTSFAGYLLAARNSAEDLYSWIHPNIRKSEYLNDN